MPMTAPNLVEVLDRHRFDHAALAAWLAQRLPGVGASLRIRQFQGGQSNPTFLLDDGSRRMVLRKKPPGVLLPSAHNVEREFAILAALDGTRVPVPRPLALCEDASVIGTAFYVMEFVDGDLYDQPHMPECGPALRRAAYDHMGRTLAALHGVDWAAVGLGGLSRPDNFLARQIERWGRQYRSANGERPCAEMEWLEAWLSERKPADSRTTIVHGDFRIGNLLFAPGEGRVAALLDWELTALGDPLSDLAYNCLAYHLPACDHGIRGMKGYDPADLGVPDEARVVEAYCRRTGRAGIPDWTFYLVFSLYRLAAIARGIHARALAGNASSADAIVFGEQTGLLIETATILARGEGTRP